jgi:hypothetical protein
MTVRGGEAQVTRGQHLVKSLPLKTSFYDSHERRSYVRMMEVAARIVDDSSLTNRGRDFLERFVRDDPHQAVAYRAWVELLRGPPETIARELLADSPRGAALRDSAPVFVAFSAAQAKELWRRSA